MDKVSINNYALYYEGQGYLCNREEFTVSPYIQSALLWGSKEGAINFRERNKNKKPWVKDFIVVGVHI